MTLSHFDWRLALALPLLFVAACSEDASPVDKRASEAKQLTAGAYEVQAKTVSMTATDKGPPASKAKAGDVATLTGCVAADGTPDASLFIEPGDQCSATQSYVSGAILNVQYHCSRKGASGSVNYSIDGQFTANAFTAKVTGGTSFTTPDDYQLIRDLSGKRVGNCPPAASVEKPKS